MLKNEPTLAIVGVDTAENGPFFFFNLNPAPVLICLRAALSILTPGSPEYARVYSGRHTHEEEKVLTNLVSASYAFHK